MTNLKCRFRQIFACILAAGVIAAGMNLAVLPVSAKKANTAADTDKSSSSDTSPDDENRSGNYGSGKLTGVSLDVYKYLKEEIQKTASGQRPSTVFDISGLVDTVTEAAEVSQNIEKINSYLLMDCPYELYWYDKSAKDAFPGLDGAISFGYNYSDDGHASNVIIRMLVSKEYRPENTENIGDDWYYTVDGSRIQVARTIPEKAQEIVDANKNKSDYEKLLAYKNIICQLVIYDEAAVGPNYNLSNEPWQLLSVFDYDSSTNVVCEGYSKAFQYLCNLSEFDDTICYTVTGGMAGGTGTGTHMWNIVKIDGNNYMVDITNCDEGSLGEPDGLFLAIPSEGSWDTQYNFSVGINYKYDSLMKELFDESVLKLADSVYHPGEDAGMSEGSSPSEAKGASEQPAASENPGSSGNSGTVSNPGTSGNPASGESGTSGKKDTEEAPDTSKKKKVLKKPGIFRKKDAQEESDTEKKSRFGVVSMDASDQGEYQVVEESIRAAYIRNDDELEFVDASKIEDVVRDQLTQKHRISASHVEVYEMELEVKGENGKWESAAAERFPQNGIRITMPYPEGTGEEGYNFYGQHLFTEDMNGYEAGTIEELEITKEKNGISFVVHGLSPVSVGWSDTSQGDAADTEQKANSGSDASGRSSSGTEDTEQKSLKKTSPKTGDESLILFYTVLLLTAVGTGGFYMKKMRNITKKPVRNNLQPSRR